jgi:hypothetical protein
MTHKYKIKMADICPALVVITFNTKGLNIPIKDRKGQNGLSFKMKKQKTKNKNT